LTPAPTQAPSTIPVFSSSIQAGRAGGAGGSKWAQANVEGQHPSDVGSTRLFLTLLPAFAPLLTQKECEH